ncbi:M20/M25/M40 family metallo-hydrolase [Streptomyces triticagri]|uniref:M20/M25/M40 family metallo-hydrolase n=1 Tax=Streptomyces triticagri TaxID=2293568 RepID=A0A372LXN0_9ACTN|nr:M20/M25/M40 family metallo-hydrolase [Streptomyces triticagri]RFU83412.1 M20/M25/M40 family metallo-hydrolase [Streptomyces triticagri]
MSQAETPPPAVDPIPILQRLIRFRSVNPPGDERECAEYVAELLAGAGIESELLGPDPERPNLVARIPGRGEAPPLLLHAHSDVVPTGGQQWTHPPFDGLLIDGEVWGRGAIDMKGGLAMMLAALLTLHQRGEAPAGDVVLAVVPDEENGSRAGAGWLTAERPDLFEGIPYAIGEDGGAALTFRPDRRFHPVGVAEKRACWLRLTLRGRGGHASRQGWPDLAVHKLTDLLTALRDQRLPTHITPALDRMLAELSGAVDQELAAELTALRKGERSTVPYELLDVADAVYLDSLLRHTVNATVIRTSDKINMIPDEITVDLDGRILPGDFTVEDYIGELREVVGPEVEIELLLEGSRTPKAEPELSPFYERLVEILREADPEGVPLPVITPASTDARLFANLGMDCYGWLPMLLPAGSRYQDRMHDADERVPADAVRFGADCLYRLLGAHP